MKETKMQDSDNGVDSNSQFSYAKGGNVKDCPGSYAEGGPVYGRTRDFMKEPNPFTPLANFRKMGPEPGSPQDYEGGKPKGKSKSAVKNVTPRT